MGDVDDNVVEVGGVNPPAHRNSRGRDRLPEEKEEEEEVEAFFGRLIYRWISYRFQFKAS